MKPAAALQDALDAALRAPETPATAAVEVLLAGAVGVGASDIHLDPDPGCLRVRLRIDGVLYEVATLPASWKARLTARVKVLAGLLTYREDVPQEGRISLPGRPALRVSVYPALHGEKVTLRVFDDARVAPALDDLGFEAATMARLRAAVTRPQGMLLLTGPSGSGKTTTIYALLAELNARGGRARSIVTIEDPVEATLPGIVQTQLHRGVGLDFQGALRALVRHDPEVIMIGEIRDRETAEIATEAGLTGHLVISTIHGGRAAGAFHRLMEMGIEPYLVASSVTAVLAQRLVRRTCRECGGAACGRCHGTGYAGRTAIAELVPVEGPVRSAILGREDLEGFEGAMRALGCATLLECAARAVSEDRTRKEETVRVLGEEVRS